MPSLTLVSDGIFQLDMPLNPWTAVGAQASSASQRKAAIILWEDPPGFEPMFKTDRRRA